jgi:4-hydroxybenzoate polyprenyltransferase
VARGNLCWSHVALPLGYLLSPALAIILAVYLAINILYSRWLKHIPILDVFIVSSGFVLRVAAGVALITVERFSPWLYMITTLFSLYIGFRQTTRRNESA